MKTKLKFIIVFSIFCIVGNLLPQKTIAQDASINFQVFYDELSPYGSWIENPEYGYVWIPDVAPDFTPYATNGYWVFTEFGWTWVSNYSWGWAPFHYGRWYTDPTYGPIWIPDNEWGPGWVSWRRSADHYGWAPMGPGISINMAFDNSYYEHFNNYTFVRGRYFGRRDMHKHYVKTSDNYKIINATTVINNPRVNNGRHLTYNAGPNRIEVEKRGGKKISVVTIKESNKPGEKINKNQLQLYRPELRKNISPGERNTPNKIATLKDVKTSEQRMKAKPAPKPNQSAKQQPSQQQRNVRTIKQQPAKQQSTQPKPQRNIQPTKQQPAKRSVQQQPMQRPAQPKRSLQPVQQQQKVQPVQQQRKPQPVQQQQKVQPVQQQQKVQPVQQQRKPQPAQQQQKVQPAQQRNVQPVQRQQPQHTIQPAARKQQSQPQQKKKEEKRSD